MGDDVIIAAVNPLAVPQFLGTLALVLAAARLMGGFARRLGQPAVLGELAAGVLLGVSGLNLVDPQMETFHMLAELGIVVLLFEIGLETDLGKLLQVGPASAAVAVAGVVVPMAGGYAVCRAMGMNNLVAIVVGATLTATSVGITARVLAELGRIHDAESRIILGAAVLDDLLGLVILAVVSGMTEGQSVTALGVAGIAGKAFGFLAVTLVVGTVAMTAVARWHGRLGLADSTSTAPVIAALGLAWLASAAGSAMVIGALAAGLLLGKTPQAQQIERAVAPLSRFFVPVYFVVIGAAVDVRLFNPFQAANGPILSLGLVLIGVALLGKFVAGFVPFWFPGSKLVIGIGMMPRGEVGLIFAQMGLSYGVFDARLFSAVTLMVMVTTFVTPPLLRLAFPPLPPEPEVAAAEQPAPAEEAS